MDSADLVGGAPDDEVDIAMPLLMDTAIVHMRNI
jgi:hypothetical protein